MLNKDCVWKQKSACRLENLEEWMTFTLTVTLHGVGLV